jgi:hypothetical protein
MKDHCGVDGLLTATERSVSIAHDEAQETCTKVRTI